MRADHCAFAALDAQAWLPNRDFQSNVAFFILRGAGWEGAVNRHGADRDVVALIDHHWAERVAYEFRRGSGDGGAAGQFAGDLSRYLDLAEVSQRVINGFEVLLNNSFAAFAVGLLDALLNFFSRLFARQNA